MCGRFSLTTQEDQIEKLFNVSIDRQMYVPRYNGAPTQNMAVITNTEQRQLGYLRWGLIPSWAKDPSIGVKMINARAESILEKVAFGKPFRTKRCLVLADSFFEWKKTAAGKIPYRIMLKDAAVFAMAGIWESWKDPEGKTIESFAIITTEANEIVQKIHHRMPVILPRQETTEYLIASPEEALQLLRPFDTEQMISYTISKQVNSAGNDHPEILEPYDYSTITLF